ncbi:RNA-binding protein 14b [Archocentrus centrarchus]|uniref:RNA-binding protein 14b n=1 Tax=Archocentrus centrarchus TaxID=63155 RepID=UPI0011E9CDF3|nr:RNA-binding protein 4-like [Archocentrus centrarchus]XP_030609294.1 RNA-binding protein 4-like [Archocentrus centrarchus]
MDKSHTVKLFVGNLALDTTQEELSAIFEPYGQVVSCSVLRQFAFVHLQGEGAAERAIRELNGREFRGRNLVVEESRGRPLHSTKVFVGNLSGMCTTEDLQQLFQTFGKVLECDKVKGYAFVHMENKEDALQAIEALHGTSFKGRPLSVELSKVQPSKQAPTGKIPCVNCGKQGHYAGECPVGKPSLEQYQSQAAVLAAAAAAAAGLPLQVQQSVHNSVYNTSTFDPTYAALTGITTGTRTDGNPVNPAVYGALASQVYGANVASQLYGTVANQAALTSGATQVYSAMAPNIYGQVAASPAAAAAAAAAAAYTTPVYTPTVANPPVYLAAAHGIEMPTAAAAVNPAYTVAPAIYGAATPAYAQLSAMGAADPATAIFEAARQAHYFAQGQQVVAEQQSAAAATAAAVAKSGERDRSPLRRSAPLLPDPVMKPFIYQRAKPRRPLLPTPAGRAAEEAVEAAEDPMARYYAEYYQQLQQYPQFQYAYPSPSTVTAIPGMHGVQAMQAVPAVPAVPTMSAQSVATLDALRPVVPTAAAVAAAMAAPRVYEPPLPPPTRKEAILRRPELSLHTPEPPFR